MKVLEKGRGEWSKRVTCTGFGNDGGGCRAKLQVGESDLTAYANFDMYGDRYGECARFKCPECGVETDLTVGAVLPMAVWKRLRDKQDG
jgi:hypothetical protein